MDSAKYLNIVCKLETKLGLGHSANHSFFGWILFTVDLMPWSNTKPCSNPNIQCESKNSPPPREIFWHFFPNCWELLVQILHTYYMFPSTLDYKFLFNYLQFWWSYAILSATAIMCSTCAPSTETYAGWSHLIWHNFVTVGDKWTKICSLAYVWMFNRCVKFGLKTLNC